MNNQYLTTIGAVKESKPKESQIQFKAGDVVQLKSGGLPMVVSRLHNIYELAEATCYWHNKKGNPKSNTFLLKTLQHIDRMFC